jgi:hypothetical protein
MTKADEDHSSIGVELLGEFAKTGDDLRVVIETCRVTLAMSKLFYDGTMRCMDPSPRFEVVCMHRHHPAADGGWLVSRARKE